jgi:hypothetical protein
MKQRFGGNDDNASTDDVSRMVTRDDTLNTIGMAMSQVMNEKGA